MSKKFKVEDGNLVKLTETDRLKVNTFELKALVEVAVTYVVNDAGDLLTTEVKGVLFKHEAPAEDNVMAERRRQMVERNTPSLVLAAALEIARNAQEATAEFHYNRLKESGELSVMPSPTEPKPTKPD